MYKILCVCKIFQAYWVIWRAFIISAGTAETHLFQYPPLPPASSLSHPTSFISLFHPFPLFFVSTAQLLILLSLCPLSPFTFSTQSSPPTVCLWVENTIINSFVSPSSAVYSIYNGKHPVASRSIWSQISNQSDLLILPGATSRPPVFFAFTHFYVSA